MSWRTRHHGQELRVLPLHAHGTANAPEDEDVEQMSRRPSPLGRFAIAVGAVAVLAATADVVALQQQDATNDRPAAAAEAAEDDVDPVAPNPTPTISPAESLFRSEIEDHRTRTIIPSLAGGAPQSVANRLGTGTAYSDLTWLGNTIAGLRPGAVDLFEPITRRALAVSELPDTSLGARPSFTSPTPIASGVAVGTLDDLFTVESDVTGELAVDVIIAVSANGDLAIATADRPGEVVRINAGTPKTIALSPDARVLAVASDNGIALLPLDEQGVLANVLPRSSSVPIPQFDNRADNAYVFSAPTGERVLVSGFDAASWPGLTKSDLAANTGDS